MIFLPRKATGLIFVQILFLLFPVSIKAAQCGNGICQPAQGETYLTCPQDCPSPTPTPTPVYTPTPTPTPTPTAGGGPTVTPGGGSTPTPTSGSGSSSGGGTSEPSPLSYPSISTPNATIITNNKTPSVTGTATVGQAEIALVEYSVDGSPWTSAKATDNLFNTKTEGFVFTVSPLSDGKHEALIRAKNSDGTYTKTEQYYHQSIVIVTQPPVLRFSEIHPNPTSSQTPTIQAEIWSPSGIPVSGELSIDNGKTWRSMKGSGRIYSVKTPPLEDDNYTVIVRARDTAGNSIQSSQSLIIDTMPPIIGATSYSFGSQPLMPDEYGVLSFAARTKNTVMVGVKGGATEVAVMVSGNSFPLSREANAYLWKGTMEVSGEENAPVVITATDGAGNKTARTLNDITVIKSGTVRNTKNATVPGAVITVYSLQPALQQWLVWDGGVFDVSNPQRVNTRGEYTIMLPKGRYYLEAKANGYKVAHSEIFDIQKPTILNQDIRLESRPVFSFSLPVIGRVSLTMPALFPSSFPMQQRVMESQKKVAAPSALLGKPVSNIVVTDVAGKQTRLASLVTGPSLITFMTSWSGSSLEHLRTLSDISEQNKKTGSVLVVMIQESGESVASLANRGKYSQIMLADPLGLTVDEYGISLVPMHIFVNKEKRIADVHVGPLDKKTMIEKLNNLR